MPLGVEHLCREVIKKGRLGLFHGVPIRHGFQVSSRGKNKTRRVWKPNVQNAHLYSETLDRRIKIQVTTTALRHIDHHGGLDNYLLNVPGRFRRSIVGDRLRAEILAKKKENPSGQDEQKPSNERFYIEKVLKPGGRVAYEMVSDQTGQRLDMKTKQEVVPVDPEEQAKIKAVPPPKPVNIIELRKKYFGK